MYLQKTKGKKEKEGERGKDSRHRKERGKQYHRRNRTQGVVIIIWNRVARFGGKGPSFVKEGRSDTEVYGEGITLVSTWQRDPLEGFWVW